MSFAGSVYGIEFLGTEATPLESPYVQGVNGTFYRKGISLHYTRNAFLEEILSNGSVVSRNGLNQYFPTYYTSDWPSDANGGLVGVYDHITRPYSYFFNVIGSDDVFIKDSFTFASNTFLLSVDSDIFMINNSGDNLYPYGFLLRLDRSELTAINLMRYSGTSYQSSNSDLTIYNRLSLLDNQEMDLDANQQVPDVIVESGTNAFDDLPSAYVYDQAKDPEIAYPITDPDIENNGAEEEGEGRIPVAYFFFGGAIVLLALGLLIVLKRGKKHGFDKN